jgi:tetratricopeptide (TPR) repeat protein
MRHLAGLGSGVMAFALGVVCAAGVPRAALAHEKDAPKAVAATSGGTPVGVVHFANSGAKAAQKDFTYGVAQLHNFQYDDAAAAFRRAQQADASFALAYWGEAMTYNHPVWMQQDPAKARAVLARLGPDRAARLARAKTERERAYLDAVETLYGDGDKFERDRRYATAMKRLHERWPDDVDATAFYALALLGTAHDGRDVPTYMRAYALVKDLFPRYPQHPGVAHYLIHSVDDAAHAPLGLEAARAYGKIAPESGHALHMTSHIFLALGMWEDVAHANEQSRAVGVRAAQKAGRAPDDCTHGLTWLSYAYLQLGRHADAKRLVDACRREAAERPKYRDDEDQFDVDASSLASFYAMRLRFLLDGPADADVAGWTPDAGRVPLAAFLADYSDAMIMLRGAGRSTAARAMPATSADAAEAAVRRAHVSADRLAAAMDRFSISPGSPTRRVVAIELGQLDALLELHRGNRDAGLAKLAAVAAEEDALPAAFGPPQVDQPTRELLGRLLLDAGKPVEARREFERALVLNPGRVDAKRGLADAARALGDDAAASVSAAWPVAPTGAAAGNL